MADNLADRSGSLVESHKGYDTRLIFFYFLITALLIALACGLAYQQLFKADIYHERERQQNQRRILIPGARGNIFDREGRLLVGNRARFSVRLHLDELRKEFLKETRIIRRNYRELGDKDIPTSGQMAQIGRYSVVQRYLDQVNKIIGRTEKINAKDLNRHFLGELLLPFTLIEDLTSEEYAKLLEQLPTTGPLQIYASSARHYPYGAAAAHVLGYLRVDNEIEAEESFAAKNLATFNDKNTFKIRGTAGESGIEAEYDSLLQGETGGVVYRVDPAGYRVDPPVYRRIPAPGKDVTLSLDIDIQQAAEDALEANRTEDTDKVLEGAAVVIDVKTGEVLALASKPGYDLNDFSPRRKSSTIDAINESEAWTNYALNGLYPPGSTFKIFTTVAAMHNGKLSPNKTIECPGFYLVGSHSFPCHNRHAHGTVDVRVAISKSCNVFYYTFGLDTGIEALATEARRFHLDRPTGIELPHETRGMNFPDPVWKKKRFSESWFEGDTANTSIGQGGIIVTPLQMACFTASIARGEVWTQPTLEHQTNRVRQKNEPIGLIAAQATAVREGMEECVKTGTAKSLAFVFKHPVRVAGKTGTAQKSTPKGKINFAWFICYAPADKPEIAIACVVKGDKLDEEFGGGTFAAPVAGKILQRYFDKKTGAIQPVTAKPANTTISLPPDPVKMPR